MGKGKYRFDRENLSYKKIEKTFGEKLFSLLPHFLGSLFIGAILVVLFFYVFDSPKALELKRENNQLISQYKVISGKMDNLDKVLKDIEYRDDNIYRTIFEAEPIPNEVREAGIGGVNKYEDLEGFENSDVVINTTKKLDNISKKMYIQSKSFDDVIELAKNKEKMLASIPAILPVDIKHMKRISSFFGMRFHPILKFMRMHEGMDFTAPRGTNIYASGDGVVVSIKKSFRGYGNRVIIDHGFSYTTLYAHMSKVSCKEGDKVKRGTIIGLVGNTGTSLGPHLHYEVRKNNHPINPINFFSNNITPEQYDEMIYKSTQEGGQSMD
jgi:murein DD-endopeptidase MepM/ murein hydrolase activator NlpD